MKKLLDHKLTKVCGYLFLAFGLSYLLSTRFFGFGDEQMLLLGGVINLLLVQVKELLKI